MAEGASSAGESCCAPRGSGHLHAPMPVFATPRERLLAGTVSIPGGKVDVGTDDPALPQDGEAPRRVVTVKPFRLGEMAVTNAQFATFIADTAYRTEAERFGWSYVFHLFVPETLATRGVVGTEWWRAVEGAQWDRPEGTTSTLAGRENHPVVHVSWNDAMAFAAWAGGRLPGEAEWEHAARGGLARATYPWGDAEPDDEAVMPCNIWQGQFPMLNTARDGHVGLAPARSFAPNGYGLFNMSGNCWEWNADAFRIRSLKKEAQARNERAANENHRLLKGGSYLCHKSYCYRYRIAARIGNTPDLTTGHTGFRLAFDA